MRGIGMDTSKKDSSTHEGVLHVLHTTMETLLPQKRRETKSSVGVGFGNRVVAATEPEEEEDEKEEEEEEEEEEEPLATT